MAETVTPSIVEERFIEAADVMKRLPEVRVPGFYSVWPKAMHEFADLVGQEPARLKRPPPGPDAIADFRSQQHRHEQDGSDRRRRESIQPGRGHLWVSRMTGRVQTAMFTRPARATRASSRPAARAPGRAPGGC